MLDSESVMGGRGLRKPETPIKRHERELGGEGDRLPRIALATEKQRLLHYGNRVGIWRLMDVLSKHGVRATSTLNSDHHPQIVGVAGEHGWEILGHNRTNRVWLDQLSPEEERQTIARTLSRIAEMTGRKPVGWLGARLAETWRTPDFLAEEGCSTSPTGSMTTSPFHGRRRQAAGLDPLFL